jgi:hypothetical protein
VKKKGKRSPPEGTRQQVVAYRVNLYNHSDMRDAPNFELSTLQPIYLPHHHEQPSYSLIIDIVYNRDISWRHTFPLNPVFHEAMPCKGSPGQWATRDPCTSPTKFQCCQHTHCNRHKRVLLARCPGGGGGRALRPTRLPSGGNPRRLWGVSLL